MKKTNYFIYTAAFSGILASMGDFIVTFTLGAWYPGYNFIHHSESYLGTSESPVAIYMNTWGVVFFLLLTLFSSGFLLSNYKNEPWTKMVAALIFFYGLGEGAGSGLFPYNHLGNELTWSGKLHSVFGAIGGIAITILPYACYRMFSKSPFPLFHRYTLIVFFSGIVLVILFLLSESEIIIYKGLLQRIYLFNYHLFLSVLALLLLSNYPSASSDRN